VLFGILQDGGNRNSVIPKADMLLVYDRHNFISTNCLLRSMSKYTAAERMLVKSIVAALAIKRVPESNAARTLLSGLFRCKQALSRQRTNGKL
jgi:hypothetical protein